MPRSVSVTADELIAALRKTKTHREAAALLGIHETTLSRLKRRYGIEEQTKYQVRPAA